MKESFIQEKPQTGNGPSDGIKLALLDFATQYSMLACGMCLKWAPRLFRQGLPNQVLGAAPGCQELESSLMGCQIGIR